MWGNLKGWKNGTIKGHKSKQSLFEKCKEGLSLERSLKGGSGEKWSKEMCGEVRSVGCWRAVKGILPFDTKKISTAEVCHENHKLWLTFLMDHFSWKGCGLKEADEQDSSLNVPERSKEIEPGLDSLHNLRGSSIRVC